MGSILRNSFRPGSLLIGLSKRGMRGGVGAPGFKRTKVVCGKMRTTLSIPGAGISYIKVFGRLFKALFRR
jgi:hypothetical protein